MTMQQHEFRIGATFWCADRRWRCTDVGTRVIAAIALDHDDDPSWYYGPPYALAEVVFDEDDFAGCTVAPDAADTPHPAAALSPPESLPAKASLADAIRRRFAPFGGVDLEQPPREPASFDTTLAEVRSHFSDMPPEELQALIDEALAAARRRHAFWPSTVDWSDAREQWDSLLDQVERGAEFIIARQGNAVARLVPAQPLPGEEVGA